MIRDPSPLSMDLAEEIKGMYRLLDVISEYGSNGCGNGPFDTLPVGWLIFLQRS